LLLQYNETSQKELSHIRRRTEQSVIFILRGGEGEKKNVHIRSHIFSATTELPQLISYEWRYKNNIHFATGLN